MSGPDYPALIRRIKEWGRELGFRQIGVAGIALPEAERQFCDWLEAGCHGEMDYMARHGTQRGRPAELLPGTLRVISARMDYLPEPMETMRVQLEVAGQGYISRYALGRDYHKLLRARLRKLALRMEEAVGPFPWRVFADSAPVLEKPLAQAAGLGWIGKHTNLIHPKGGSWFFLGEIYVGLPLPTDTPVEKSHCGSCTACMTACPTGAIVAPYRLDARRCISYLTIELHGAIPEEFRPAIGNRVYGCDDCQLVCPWNRFARLTEETDFLPRHGLDSPRLIDLFGWDEAEFLRKSEGSAIRRLGHERWLRNLAVALGNAPPSPEIAAALESRLPHPSELVREHVLWALERQRQNFEACVGCNRR